MTGQLVDLVAILLIGAAAGAIGLGLGIFVLAPRISRAIERHEQHEDDRDGRD